MPLLCQVPVTGGVVLEERAAIQLCCPLIVANCCSGMVRNAVQVRLPKCGEKPRLAALPVAYSEFLLQISWKVIGQVEVISVSDGRKAIIEAPVAAHALPQPALELDAEADPEGLVALDDGVMRV